MLGPRQTDASRGSAYKCATNRLLAPTVAEFVTQTCPVRNSIMFLMLKLEHEKHRNSC